MQANATEPTVATRRSDQTQSYFAAMRKLLQPILMLCAFGWASAAQAVIPASQRAALIDMYNSTNGASWVNKTNWNGAVGTECTWFGITCDTLQANVLTITLDSNNLAGPFPTISGLPALLAIDVFGNKLTGSLPTLSGMNSLTFFRAGGNLLAGAIPSFSGVPNLQNFLACCQQLTGPLPAAPSTLRPGGSNLCGNPGLTSSGVAAIDAAWDVASLSGRWQACPTSAGSPVCTLTASPSAITLGRSSTLTASCNPMATTFSWAGGTCAGTIGPTCIVTPNATTAYTVTGSNANGPGLRASATVAIVAPVFPLTVTNASTPTVANIAANLQYRPQDVQGINSVYVFALAPAGLVRDVPPTALSDPKGPAVAGEQAADGPAVCVLAQLLNGELKFSSTSNLQPFLIGVLGSLGASVNVLNGVSTVIIGGAVFYVGYGTNPATMILNGTNQTVATIPGANTCLPQTPQSGWWWYPLQDGRGFGIEVQGNNMFMSGYLYDSTGHATWMVAEGKVSIDGSVFSNKLYQVANGQTLTGTYKPPGSLTFPGDITLSFTNSRSGTLVWPGGIIPIQRFDDVIGQKNGVTPAFVPETGWWWNQAESGRGYFIEVKNNYAFIAGYMYEADGRPVWYIAEGTMTTPQSFSSNWYEAANGQTLTGVYKKPNILNAKVGTVSIQFLTTTTATLLLPDGRQLSITRQRY